MPYQEAEATVPNIDLYNLGAKVVDIALKAVTLISDKAFQLWGVIQPYMDKVGKALFALLKKKILDLLVDDIVTWIQGGGTPQFITDWKAFAEKVVDQAGGEFVDQILGLGILCNRFGAQLRLMLAKPKTFNTVKCTLTKIGTNIENFFDNFSNGGWTNWIALNESQNNLYGAYLTIADQRLAIESAAARAAQNEGTASAGFLGDKICLARQCPDSGPERYTGVGGWKESELGQCVCLNWQIRTPGRIAADAISMAVVDVPILGVLSAREYSEYLGAIADAAINRTLKEGFLYIKTNATKRGTIANDLAKTAQAVGSLLNPFCTIARLGALLRPILSALKGAVRLLNSMLGVLRGVARGLGSLRDVISFLPGMVGELTNLITFARCNEPSAPGLPPTVSEENTASIYEKNKDLAVTLADKLKFLQEALTDYRTELNLSIPIAEEIKDLRISSAKSLNKMTDRRCLLPTGVTKTTKTNRTDNCTTACPCTKTTKETTVFNATITVTVEGVESKEKLEPVTVIETTTKTMGKLEGGTCSAVAPTLPAGATPPCIPCDPICEKSTETTIEVTTTNQENSPTSLKAALEETNTKLADIEEAIGLVTECAIAATDYLSSNPSTAQLSEEQLKELQPILEALGLANDAFTALIPTIDQIIDDTIQKILALRDGRGLPPEVEPCDTTTLPLAYDFEKEGLYVDLCNAKKLDSRFSLYSDACPCVTYYDGNKTPSQCSQAGNCFDATGKTSIICPQCTKFTFENTGTPSGWPAPTPRWPDNFSGSSIGGATSLDIFKVIYQIPICTDGCYDTNGQKIECPATCNDAWAASNGQCSSGCYGANNVPVSCTNIAECFASESCPDGCYDADSKPVSCPAIENKCFDAADTETPGGRRITCPTCGFTEQGLPNRCPDGCYAPAPCPAGCYVGNRKILNEQGVLAPCADSCYDGTGFIKLPCPANVSL